MKVLIFGDLAITKSNEIKFAEGKIQDVFSKEIISLFHDVDFSLFNLESPLYDSFSEPIKKCGPTLGANKECINGIRELNPSLVCVANNHIYDYGYSGFSTTLSELQNNNIPTIGGILDGNSKEYCVKNEVAILNVAENEFSFNYKDRSGAYCLSSSVFSKIRELKENTKRVVVVFHGGTENIQYPSPDLIEICHAFVDLGADLVLCQHSHRIGCFENYKDAKIVYGQGNFLFDEYSKSVEWTHGLGIIYDSNANDVEFILTSFKNSVVQILNNDPNKVLEGFYNRSKELETGDYYTKYKAFSRANYAKYLCKLRGYSKLRTGIEVVLFKGFFITRRYFGKRKYVLYDILNCEAHRELIKTTMKDQVFHKKN